MGACVSMRRRTVLGVIFFMLSVLLSGCSKENTEPISTDFQKFSNMYSSLKGDQEDEFWKKNKGAYVQWTGVYVTTHKVPIGFIGVEIRQPDKLDYSLTGYDFLVRKDHLDTQKLGAIKNGDIITVKGKLNDEKGIFSDWVLSNAQIVSVEPGQPPLQYEIFYVNSGQSYKTYWVYVKDSSRDNLINISENFFLDHRDDMLEARSGFQIRFFDKKSSVLSDNIAAYASTPHLKLQRLSIFKNGKVAEEINF